MSPALSWVVVVLWLVCGGWAVSTVVIRAGAGRLAAGNSLSWQPEPGDG